MKENNGTNNSSFVKIPSLDGLRAISIFVVILGHLNVKYEVVKEWLLYFHSDTVLNVITNAPLGVQLFFAISGFLITFLLINEEAKFGKINFKKFYIRRTLRIFPAYYFVILCYFLLQLFGQINLSATSWITSITYTKYFSMDDWLTNHFWSLSVEEHFYLFWPVVFYFFPKFRVIFLWFIIFIVLFLRIYLSYYPVSWIYETSLFLKADALALGCLLSFYYNSITLISTNFKKILFYISVFFLLTYKLYIGILNDFIDNKLFFVAYDAVIKSLSNLTITYLIFYSIQVKDSIWFKVLNLKWLTYIGLLSYSIYLWQQLFINDTGYFYNKFPFNIIGILIMALFSYYVIEKPFLKLKHKFETK